MIPPCDHKSAVISNRGNGRVLDHIAQIITDSEIATQWRAIAGKALGVKIAMAAITIIPPHDHNITGFDFVAENVFDRLILAFALTLAWAVLDEAYQTTIPGRYGSVTDLALNVIGASLAIALAALRGPLRRNQRSEPERM